MGRLLYSSVYNRLLPQTKPSQLLLYNKILSNEKEDFKHANAGGTMRYISFGLCAAKAFGAATATGCSRTLTVLKSPIFREIFSFIHSVLTTHPINLIRPLTTNQKLFSPTP